MREYCTMDSDTERFQGPFQDIEAKYPNLVAIDSKGQMTGNAMDFRGYSCSIVNEG